MKWLVNRMAGRDPTRLFRVFAVKVLVQIPPKFEEDFREVGRIVNQESVKERIRRCESGGIGHD